MTIIKYIHGDATDPIGDGVLLSREQSEKEENLKSI